ncbi:NAD(P)/FAD-dependent oxidoreductase [Pseudonocardia phyllosphaerae]|uniref:NAD(P)/FAD-dependent oxidoreductase n=1 Tax=Pseudonocardia phyllosphaerae TaxID=3390502 RepID=UPI00397BC8E9
MGVPEHVLVVGAGLGGLRTVEDLRRAGYEGRIGLVGAEDALPYDRPPLSKQYLAGERDRAAIDLTTADDLDELGVRLHLGRAAVALRPGADGHEVELDDGSALHADAVVLAVGAAARAPDGGAGVHVLRTADDAGTLRAALATASSLLVVGAGFVGAEVASTATAAGIPVTVLEAAPVPLARALGAQVGALAARLMTEGGVDLRCNARITALSGTGAESADGSTVTADVVVAGIGTRLDLGWLDGTGVDLSGGIPCDTRGRVEGLDGVWAVGDAAAWTDPVHGDRPRHEHWTSATDQAAAVARDIAGDVAGAGLPPQAVPYVWSDQFGLKIQLIGRPELADAVLPLHGEAFGDDGDTGGPIRGTVVGYLSGGELVAVAGFGAARRIARYRRPLAERASRDAVLAFRDALG